MKKRTVVLRWVNRILLLFTLICGLGSLLPSHWLPGASVLTLLFPFFFLSHLILLILVLRFSPKNALPNLIGLLLTFFPTFAQVPFSTPPVDSDPTTIATYNVRAFYQVDKAAEQIARWSSNWNIDVLCLQEVRKSRVSTLEERYPFRAYAPAGSSYSVAILSNYEILESSGLTFDGMEQSEYFGRSAIYADVVLPFDTVRILNIHLSSTGVRDGDMSVEPTREQLLEAGQFLARTIASSDAARGIQAESILNWVQESPYPVILAGDFNGVPGGNLYARLLTHLNDPYVFKGHGDMGTFEPLKRRYLPLKIDWTLHSPELHSTGQFVDHVPYSDHFPLITTFLPPPVTD